MTNGLCFVANHIQKIVVITDMGHKQAVPTTQHHKKSGNLRFFMFNHLLMQVQVV